MAKEFIVVTQHSIDRFFERVNSKLFVDHKLTRSDDHDKIKAIMLKVMNAGEVDKSYLNDKVFLGKLYDKYGYDNEIKFVYNREYSIVYVLLCKQKSTILLTVLSKEMAKVDKDKYSHIDKKSKFQSFGFNAETDRSLVAGLVFEYQQFFDQTEPTRCEFVAGGLHGELITDSDMLSELGETRSLYTADVRFMYIHERQNELILYHKRMKKSKALFLNYHYDTRELYRVDDLKNEVVFNDYLNSLISFRGKSHRICVDTVNNKAFVFYEYGSSLYLTRVYDLSNKA